MIILTGRDFIIYGGTKAPVTDGPIFIVPLHNAAILKKRAPKSLN